LTVGRARAREQADHLLYDAAARPGARLAAVAREQPALAAALLAPCLAALRDARRARAAWGAPLAHVAAEWLQVCPEALRACGGGLLGELVEAAALWPAPGAAGHAGHGGSAAGHADGSDVGGALHAALLSALSDAGAGAPAGLAAAEVRRAAGAALALPAGAARDAAVQRLTMALVPAAAHGWTRCAPAELAAALEPLPPSALLSALLARFRAGGEWAPQ
jgi:hypothetical protein